MPSPKRQRSTAAVADYASKANTLESSYFDGNGQTYIPINFGSGHDSQIYIMLSDARAFYEYNQSTYGTGYR